MVPEGNTPLKKPFSGLLMTSVTVAAMNALVTLAPAWGIAELREILADGAADRIELAAVALGGSRNDEALTALVSPDEVDEMITLFHVTGGYTYVDP